MTSIVAHKVLQALLMLATSDICPDADWYGEPTDYSGQYVTVQKCAVPLANGMSKTDARAFWRLARKLSGRIDQRG